MRIRLLLVLFVFVVGCRSEPQGRVADAERRLLRQAVDVGRIDLSQEDDWEISFTPTEPFGFTLEHHPLPSPRSIEWYQLFKAQGGLQLRANFCAFDFWSPEIVQVAYGKGDLQLTILWRSKGLPGPLAPGQQAVAVESPPPGETVRQRVVIELQSYEGMHWYKRKGERGRTVARFEARVIYNEDDEDD